MPTWIESMTRVSELGFEPTGLFPVTYEDAFRSPETRSIVLVDPSDALFTARPAANDSIYRRAGDRRALANLISRLAG
jgi:hypothetical protein